MKFPSKLGPCIDLAYSTREKRLAYQREVEKVLESMKAEEEAINTHILNTFDKVEIEQARGTLCSASIIRSVVPSKIDWPTVWKYIQKTGEFDLLEKRMAKVAWRERYEAGKTIPGTEPFDMITLSLTKINK